METTSWNAVNRMAMEGQSTESFTCSCSPETSILIFDRLGNHLAQISELLGTIVHSDESNTRIV